MMFILLALMCCCLGCFVCILFTACNEKHYFHAECIKKWIEKNASCPLCKSNITLEILQNMQKAPSSNAANRNVDANIKVNSSSQFAHRQLMDEV
mmetsp:Transcript_18357/g.21110  ORF Transcript_18357/g.21110 Transcript_18357/m.21110 type:complete len:95 (+) Transcript_18357:546-830(+)